MASSDTRTKCLFFDVFGTCVDWRGTVTNTLWKTAEEALNSPTASLASKVRTTATEMVSIVLVHQYVKPKLTNLQDVRAMG